MEDLSGKAILCPKNEDPLKINEQVLVRVPCQNVTYFSADSIISEYQEEQNNFQLDFINGITPSEMPPHVLNLKVGAIIMLLKNLNPSTGLCNGTRLLIRKLMSNVIDAELVILLVSTIFSSMSLLYKLILKLEFHYYYKFSILK
ncbi:ATP-dependent DNA helicase [Trichonephila inaurata madagascariensis]|uniref:ATP-dependent DNA helicase n=1 Tax=Trichonephila inaurata madagascariensis TaxID=2747483 RepID=A0A8X6YUI0_9ARAC|nr:ATP-dependent DNA helicase [Trichonephila inaurata madagascariensis]